MSDAIDRVPGATSSRSAEKISATTPAGMKLKRDEESGFSYEDQVDIGNARYAADDTIGGLDISVELVRALIAGELPQEAIDAMKAYAPLGDMSDAAPLYERIAQQGVETIKWPAALTLRQALERAAS